MSDEAPIAAAQRQNRVVLEEFDETPAPALAQRRTELNENQVIERSNTREAAPLAPLAPRRSYRLLLGGVLGIGVVSLAQLGVQLWQQLGESPLLGTAWLLAWAALVAGCAGVGLREWTRLRRMRNRQDARSRAEQMLARHGVGQARAFCIELARQGALQQSAGYRDWLGAIEQTHNDREVLEIYSTLVLAAPDENARRCVVRHARDTAVMVAFSQFAAVDMLLMFWRNMRLLEEICALYGNELGYWGRIGLLRQVLRNIAYAGAAEVVSEVGLEMTGAGITGKLSTGLAQGIGAGLLTARLGLRAMDACRPIPWIANEKPSLDKVRSEMNAMLRESIAKL